MRSSLPKVLHPIAKKPMVQHVIDTSKALNAESLQLIYGFGADELKARIEEPNLNWVLQAEQLGTGHAVQQVIPHITDEQDVLILYGDVPLIRTETLQGLLEAKPQGGIGLLTVVLDDPSGYGRIVRDNGIVTGIIEHKDATPEQHKIQEVNTGILVANGGDLKRWLSNLSNDNAQGEYYLTDIIAMAYNEGRSIEAVQASEPMEVEGANNRVQLSALERAYQARLAHQLMIDGATLMDPARIDIRGEVEVGQEVVIDVNAVFEGVVKLGNDVQIGPNCYLKDCEIADGAVIKANSVIEEAKVGENCNVGPFARLRPGAEMAEGAMVGNFVEMKKTYLGKGSKASHLTYLGDTQVGEGANIGAGTITCNYDGVNKFKTQIGNGAFIGSNSSLVAPVSIGDFGTVGAGSVISKDVEENELAIARGKQKNISGWQRPGKK